jgi:hypothetical protein
VNYKRTALLLGLFLLASLRATAGTLYVCNDGSITAQVATATENSFWFEAGHTWRVEGWMTAEPRKCVRQSTDPSHPVYIAVAFTDFLGRWGAAEFEPGKDDSAFVDAHIHLCVDHARFSYTRSGSHPGGPCKTGYFPIPASSYLDPSGDGTFTLHFNLTPDSLATPVDDGSLSKDAGGSDSGESHAVAEAAGAVLGIAAAFIIGKAVSDSGKSGSASSTESGTASAPDPFAPGTLNAILFDKRVVRLASGSGPWFYENGSRVSANLGLEGQTQSDLFDPPKQRASSDSEVSAAQSMLAGALSQTPWAQRSNVSDVGRLYYAFQDRANVWHQAWVNVATLDFARARHFAGDGYAGIEIPCRSDRACMLGEDQNAAGATSNQRIYSSIDIYFKDDERGRAAWSSLQKLRKLYPATPAVIAR